MPEPCGEGLGCHTDAEMQSPELKMCQCNSCNVDSAIGLWVAHSVKALPCKKGDLSSIPWTHTKMEGVVVRARNPHSGDTDTRGSLGTHWPASSPN